ncbi:MAG: PAS domain S-box protein [Desulfobacteraceae bacterium]|nr:PAS domain S-box protein [Desulfobacteraceae bacterium]
MAGRPMHEELEQRVKELENEAAEHKHAKEALRKSQQRYKDIVEKVNDIIYTLDVEGKITSSNTAVKAFGYHPEEIIGKNFVEFISSEVLEETLKDFHTVLDTGEIIAETVLVGKNGEPHFVEYSSTVIKEQGRVVGIRGIVRDITDRKEAQEALQRAHHDLERRVEERTAELKKANQELQAEITDRMQAEESLIESEEKFRTVSEQSPNMIFINKNGRIVYTNKLSAETMGYERDEFYSPDFDFFSLIAPESIEVVKSAFKGHMEGKEVEPYEYTLVNREGKKIESIIATKLINYEGERAILGIVTDISERMRTEEALRESEEKYRLLVENANDAIFIAQDQVVKFPNPKTLEMIGYSAEELVKTPFMNLIHPEDRDMVLDRYIKRLKGKELPSTYSFRIKRRDGEELWVEISTVLITWEGRPATLNFLRDVTPQKKMEAQFQQALKMEAIGTLAGGLAHNINNLLMAILGNASIMLLDVDLKHPHHRNLKSIEKQVQNGSKLTRQLLGYAREGRYEVKPMNLNRLVKETAETFDTTRKEIIVHQEFAENLYGIEVDQGQIEQVLLNLYVNAADAMPRGGDLFIKTVNVTNKDMRGKPYTPKPGNYVLLTVRDTGLGMDKKTMDRIFDPFFTTKGLAQGTGLGLASAYGIVKGHGGYIDVFSGKEKGTTFEIYLPATNKEVEEEEELSGEFVEGRDTVLLVDDEELVLDAGEQMLRRLGYEVLVAGSGQEALALYEKNHAKIDIVLLDMVIPGMGGGETYDRMREIDPTVKVLLSSGYSIDGEATEILERGCDGFIQKPFDLIALSQEIREILDK